MFRSAEKKPPDHPKIHRKLPKNREYLPFSAYCPDEIRGFKYTPHEYIECFFSL
jgi:hypothetical protein